MQPNIFSRQPPSFRSFIIAVITCLLVLFFDWRMPHVVKPARDVLYAAYNPIYALASYPVMSREWLNQQTKSEEQLRRENTAMHAELLQAQVRLQKLSELSAENARLRGLLDTPLIIDGRMEIAEVIGTDVDPLRHIIVINRGKADRLYQGQTVLDDHGIMGQIIRPSEKLDQDLTAEFVMEALNNNAEFDFDYNPEDGDELLIGVSYKYPQVGNHYRPLLPQPMTFVYENKEWYFGYIDHFRYKQVELKKGNITFRKSI